MIHRILPLAILIFTTLAHAGGVRIVDSPQLDPFTSIQAAVDAATDGDTLLVGSGEYGPFAIDGKSVSIVAMPGAIVEVLGTIEVRNLPATGRVLISGLASTGDVKWPTSKVGLRVAANDGHVRLQSCIFRGGEGFEDNDDSGSGGHGARVANSPQVVFTDCQLLGGGGYGQGSNWVNSPAGDGGDGLSCGAKVALYGCLAVGGKGGDTGSWGGDGGSGSSLAAGILFASGCTFQGGDGGFADDFILALGGDGGHGLAVLGGTARLLDNQYGGGSGGQSLIVPGVPGVGLFNGGGAIDSYPGTARELTAGGLHVEQTSAMIVVRGVPGDWVYLAWSPHPDFAFSPKLLGTRLVPFPFLTRTTAQGVIDASGTLLLQVPLPRVSEPDICMYLQGLIVDSGGQHVLGSPLHMVLLDREALPDCNGNGVSDFVDVLVGTSSDCDSNIQPDECHAACTTWYVDASAPPGGDGSSSSPFKTLAKGVAPSVDGDTVLVLDGLYTGAGNREVDLGGRNIHVRSQNGWQACTIDCQGQGRAFLVSSGGVAAVIEGFTIQNGQAYCGGAIEAMSGGVTIKDCRLLDCDAGFMGGGIFAYGPVKILGCMIVNCHAKWGGGISFDLRTHLPHGEFSVLRESIVTGCSASSDGGGVYMMAFRGVGVSHCTFTDNTAARYGGGMRALVYLSDLLDEGLSLNDTRFANNAAEQGGGLSLYTYSNPVRIAGCSFTGNTATVMGGGLHCGAFCTFCNWGVDLVNTILWNDSAPVGPELALPSGSEVRVAYCDVEGGFAGAFVDTNSGLTWGPGNIDADPQFLSPHLDLSVTSPCIDAGDNDGISADRSDVDGDGNIHEPVPLDAVLASRRVDIASVPDTGSGAPPLVDIGAMEKQQ